MQPNSIRNFFLDNQRQRANLLVESKLRKMNINLIIRKSFLIQRFGRTIIATILRINYSIYIYIDYIPNPVSGYIIIGSNRYRSPPLNEIPCRAKGSKLNPTINTQGRNDNTNTSDRIEIKRIISQEEYDKIFKDMMK